MAPRRPRALQTYTAISQVREGYGSVQDEAQRLLWVASVCWASSPVWLEHVICPTAVAACFGSSGSCPSALQRDRVNLSLLCEGHPAMEMHFVQLLHLLAAALVCSSYAWLFILQNAQRTAQREDTGIQGIVSCE
jgi:hypothetical protein